MALISGPSTCFSTRPTLGLDVRARRELWKLVEGLKKQITIILTTHYLEEAAALARPDRHHEPGKMRIVGTAEDRRRHGQTSLEEAFLQLTEGKQENEEFGFCRPRNRREILRDPLSAVFGIGFPVVLILLMSLMNRSIRGCRWNCSASRSSPRGWRCSASFIALFLGMLIANDRNNAFLSRLFACPMRDGIYPGLCPADAAHRALLQRAACFITAFFFRAAGQRPVLAAMAALIPSALLFIGFGLLMGSLLSSGQVGGIGSILVNVATWLSGTWFGLDMIGGPFRTGVFALPLRPLGWMRCGRRWGGDDGAVGPSAFG